MYYIVGAVYDMSNQLMGYRYIDELLRICYMSKSLLLYRVQNNVIKLDNATLNDTGTDIQIRGVQAKDIPKVYMNGDLYIPNGEKQNITIVGRYPNKMYLCYLGNILCVFAESELIRRYHAGTLGFMNVRIVKGSLVSKVGSLPDITKNGTGYISISNDCICRGPRYLHYHTGLQEPSDSILAEIKQKCPTLVLHKHINKVGMSAFQGFNIPFNLKSQGKCKLSHLSFKESGVRGIYGTYDIIGQGAFENSAIKIIDCNISNICTRAFMNCEQLSDVHIAKNLNHIGTEAFANSTIKTFKAIMCVNVSAGAFANCTQLENVALGYNIYIGKGAFYNTKKLTLLNCTIANLGEEAFLKSGIKHIDITTDCIIPTRCFAHSALRSITLGNIDIGEQAFFECNDLLTITFRDSEVGSIGNGAFYNTGIGRLQIRVRGIVGEQAFASCRNLEKVELTVPTASAIGNRAFEKCPNLATVVINTNDRTMVDIRNIFVDCPKLKEVSINGEVVKTGI